MYFGQFLDQLVQLLTPDKILVLLGSTILGMAFGALPGLTATLAVALLSTATFGLPYDIAIVALLGAYNGAIYGPSHSSIMLGIPGTSAGAATVLDGHQLAKQGRGGEAIATATISSVVGTLFGILSMLVAIPLLTSLALQFTSVEFFLLAVFGVLICGSLTAPDLPAKGWIAGFLGLALSMVGIETIQGYRRFLFGFPELAGGIDVVPVILGGFALPQIVRALKDPQAEPKQILKATNMKPNWRVFFKNIPTIIRSALIGIWVGAVPGVGEDIAAWTSYDTAKRLSKEKEKFGKGSFEGVIAPEVANNAAVAGAIIPVLTLGIPGSPPAAMLIGALWLHGIRPGPMLSFEMPEVIPQMAATLFLAAISILVCGFLLIQVSVRILQIPQALLMPIVAVFTVLGSYALGLNMFNVYLMLLFGFVVYLLEEIGYPVPPLVIGLILGGMADVSLRRALLASQGSVAPFFTRPVALVLLLLIVFSLVSRTQVFRKGWERFRSRPAVASRA